MPRIHVRVELIAPSRALWIWGPEDALEKIAGPGEDFCLVVVQRRRIDDTRIESSGDGARDWMLKAQCIAGPPSDGPEPGERLSPAR